MARTSPLIYLSYCGTARYRWQSSRLNNALTSGRWLSFTPCILWGTQPYTAAHGHYDPAVTAPAPVPLNIGRSTALLPLSVCDVI